MTKYLDIREAGTSESGKTRVWQCVNVRTGEMAGEVRYRYGFRGYAFYPTADFFFDANCLEQISEHIRLVNGAKRMEKKA